MNKVFFRQEFPTGKAGEASGAELPLPFDAKEAESFIKKVLKTMGKKDWELSVLFCNNRYIKSLNSQYRNKKEATDVLSFPLGETSPAGRFMAGDIVISLEALEENTRFFSVSANEELRRLLVHGILHLAGEDHATNKAEEPMLKTQEKILAQLTEKIH